MSLCHSSDNFKYISFQFCPWEHLPTKLVVILLSPTQNIFISFSPHLSGISFLPTVWPAFLFTHLIHHSIVSGVSGPARNLTSKIAPLPLPLLHLWVSQCCGGMGNLSQTDSGLTTNNNKITSALLWTGLVQLPSNPDYMENWSVIPSSAV